MSQLDEEIEDLVADQAVAAMEGIRDALTLLRNAPEIPCRKILGAEQGMLLEDYVWRLEQNFNHVRAWLTVLKSGSDKQLAKKFLTAAVEDMYNYDRALRAAEINHLEKPLRLGQLTQIITRT